MNETNQQDLQQNAENEPLQTDQKEQCPHSEWDKNLAKSPYAFGVYAIIATCILLTIINMIFLESRNFFDYTAILFSFVMVMYFAKFKHGKQKTDLLVAILFAIAFVLTITSYIVNAL